MKNTGKEVLITSSKNHTCPNCNFGSVALYHLSGTDKSTAQCAICFLFMLMSRKAKITIPLNSNKRKVK